MDNRKFKNLIIDLLKEKKAQDIVVLDLRKVTTLADYFIICTGSAQPHIKSISDNVLDKLSDQGIKCWHKEGIQSLNWVLLDYVDIVVHIFSAEAREFYKLEKFWADAKKTIIKDDEVID